MHAVRTNFMAMTIFKQVFRKYFISFLSYVVVNQVPLVDNIAKWVDGFLMYDIA